MRGLYFKWYKNNRLWHYTVFYNSLYKISAIYKKIHQTKNILDKLWLPLR